MTIYTLNTPIYEFEPGPDWLREHIIAVDEKGLFTSRTKCGKATFSPETDRRIDPDGTVSEDIWFSDHEREKSGIVKCVHCLNAWPRFGDGFVAQLGVRTAIFTKDFYEAHSGDVIGNTREYARYLLGNDKFDTAVPAPWCNDVWRLTGIYPTTLGMVTYEGEFTEVFPLTIAAYCLIGWYRAAVKAEDGAR